MKRTAALLFACAVLSSFAAAEETLFVPGSLGNVFCVMKVPEGDGPFP